MSKGNTYENELLEHILNNAAIPNIGDAAGLPASATAGNLHLSLHTADPGEAGDQTTNEISYTGYARVAIARDGTGWTVTGNSAALAADKTFGEMTGGAGGTATHFVVGTDASGVGKLLYSGTISPNISVTTGVVPELTTGTAITED